jgi:hypothetical protein
MRLSLKTSWFRCLVHPHTGQYRCPRVKSVNPVLTGTGYRYILLKLADAMLQNLTDPVFQVCEHTDDLI